MIAILEHSDSHSQTIIGYWKVSELSEYSDISSLIFRLEVDSKIMNSLVWLYQNVPKSQNWHFKHFNVYNVIRIVCSSF